MNTRAVNSLSSINSTDLREKSSWAVEQLNTCLAGVDSFLTMRGFLYFQYILQDLLHCTVAKSTALVVGSLLLLVV